MTTPVNTFPASNLSTTHGYYIINKQGNTTNHKTAIKTSNKYPPTPQVLLTKSIKHETEVENKLH